MDNSNNNYTGYNQPLFPEDDNVDIKRYLSLFISNWYWFAIALYISLTLAYGINRYSEEVYTISSTLLIQDDQYGNTRSGLSSIIPGGDIFRSGQNLNNEIGILKSFKLNYRVISELPEFNIIYGSIGRRGIAETKLYKDCPFMVVADSLKVQPETRINIHIISKDSCRIEIDSNIDFKTDLKFGQRFNQKGFDFVIRLRDPRANYSNGNIVLLTRYYFYFESKEGLANSYRGKLRISPIAEGASVVNMAVSGYIAEKEADYLNKLMDLYIKNGLEYKNATADSTINFINEQLGIIADSLRLAENDMEKFKLSNKILNLSSEGSFIKNKLEQLENEKSAIELQQKYFDYLTEYIESKNESGDIVSPSTIGVTDQELIGLVSNLAQAQKKRKQLTFNLLGDLPPLGYVDNEVNLARATLNENVKNSANSLLISLDNDRNRISETEVELMKLPEKERLMIGIQRKFDLNNSVYTYLLEKRAEAGIAMASTVSENRIIDRAGTFNSYMVRPKKKQNIYLAILLGFLLPGISIFLIDYLNNKIMDKKDVEKGTNAPILGFISHCSDKNEIPVVTKPGSTLAESFRSIRTSLKYYTKGSDPLIISITSTISSEGKTFTSVNLAAIISMLGKKVLLLGLDLRKPKIHKVFNIVNEEGMSTYLSGNCDYADVITKTSVENLYYAASGPVPPNPAELLETDKVKDFFERAKKEFDFIIIDTPPVAVVTDALLLTAYVDLNIFIVRQRYSSKNTIDLIDELYKGGRFKNMAIIINDISLSGYYGYGLRYGYSMGYGYTYGYNYYGKYSNTYGYSDKEHGYYTD